MLLVMTVSITELMGNARTFAQVDFEREASALGLLVEHLDPAFDPHGVTAGEYVLMIGAGRQEAERLRLLLAAKVLAETHLPEGMVILQWASAEENAAMIALEDEHWDALMESAEWLIADRSAARGGALSA